MRKTVLVGATDLAQVIRAYLTEDPELELCGAAVDRQWLSDSQIDDLPVCPLDELSVRFPSKDHQLVMAIGYTSANSARADVYGRLASEGYGFHGYKHPTASIAVDAKVDNSAMIFANAVVEPGANVGANSIIWANVTVGHHANVGEHCWVAAGTTIGGNATVGDLSFVGLNATIVNHVKVGRQCIIGSAAHITREVGDDEVHLARSAEKHRFSASDYARFALK